MITGKLLGASSAVAIGLISAATLWLFLQHDFCENIVLDVLASPDGRWQAVAFERDCGATASTSMNISLMTNSDNPQGSGNIFVSEGRSAQLAWKNSLVLEVVFNPDDRVFRERTDYSGVTILYSPQPSDKAQRTPTCMIV